MFKYIKDNLSIITAEVIKDYIKSKIVYFLPVIFTYGGNMITENTIGWFLILIASLIGVYLLKNSIQKITNTFLSVHQNILDLCSCSGLLSKGEWFAFIGKNGLKLNDFINSPWLDLIDTENITAHIK